MLPAMKIRSKILSTVALVAATLCLPLAAQAGAIEQLHDFLKTTRTLKADFSQSVLGKNGRKS